MVRLPYFPLGAVGNNVFPQNFTSPGKNIISLQGRSVFPKRNGEIYFSPFPKKGNYFPLHEKTFSPSGKIGLSYFILREVKWGRIFFSTSPKGKICPKGRIFLPYSEEKGKIFFLFYS